MNAIVDQNGQNGRQCFIDSFTAWNKIQSNFINKMSHNIFPTFKPEIPLIKVSTYFCSGVGITWDNLFHRVNTVRV